MVKIGLIADIQYADRGDKGRCLFRSSLDRLKQVVELFNAEGLDLVVQLGDVLDGNPQDEEGLAQSRSELDRVLEVLGELRCPLEHVVGNHCLALPRPELQRRLGLPRAQRILEVQGRRIALLDSLAVSLYDKNLDPQDLEEAHSALALGQAAGEPWAVDWNGALGERQREWLRRELLGPRRPDLFLCHHPIYPSAARARFLAWDHQEVLALLGQNPAEPVTWISGHDHQGGRALDGANLHWTLPGLVAATEVRGLERQDRDGFELFAPRLSSSTVSGHA
jgi:predicted phosphodiesterase